MQRYRKCNVGEAVITGGYNLSAKYIIHAVGPVWNGGYSGEAKLLHNCYTSSLKLAHEHKCKSVAFPLISSGIYGHPKDQALQVAISAISEFFLRHDMTVYLVVYDKDCFMLSGKLFSKIEKYIDDNYVEEHRFSERSRNIPPYEYQQQKYIRLHADSCMAPAPNGKRSLEDVIGLIGRNIFASHA